MKKPDAWDEHMKTEGFKDYYIIECYQYITDELDRDVAIRSVESCKTHDEAKAVIAKARGLA